LCKSLEHFKKRRQSGFTTVKTVNYQEAFAVAHYNGELTSPEAKFMVKALTI